MNNFFPLVFLKKKKANNKIFCISMVSFVISYHDFGLKKFKFKCFSLLTINSSLFEKP